MVVKKGRKKLEDEMLPEEYFACMELYRMQFIRLSSTEQLKLSKMVNRTRSSDKGNVQIGDPSLGLSCKGNAPRNNLLLKIKHQSLKTSRSMLPQFDCYVPPRVPLIKGLDGLIEECTSPFEKQLTVSDLNGDQSRLAFSRLDAEKFLLPLVKGENLKLGVSTTVYDMEGNSYPMTFKNWCDKYYVLTSGWKDFCKSHDLIPVADFVTVWMFQHGETKQLCFALSSRRRDVDHLIKISRRS